MRWLKFSAHLWILDANPSQATLILFLDQLSWEGSSLPDWILKMDTIPNCGYKIQFVPCHADTIVQHWLWLSKYSPLSSQPCHASLSLSLSPLGVFADIPALSLSFSLFQSHSSHPFTTQFSPLVEQKAVLHSVSLCWVSLSPPLRLTWCWCWNSGCTVNYVPMIWKTERWFVKFDQQNMNQG